MECKRKMAAMLVHYAITLETDTNSIFITLKELKHEMLLSSKTSVLFRFEEFLDIKRKLVKSRSKTVLCISDICL